MKRFAINVTLVFATVVFALVLWQLREAVVLFVLALAAAGTLRPGVDLLVARRVPRGRALALTCVLVLAAVATAALVLGVPAFAEARRGADLLMRAYDLASGSQESLLRKIFIERLPASAGLYHALGSEEPGSGAHAVLGVAEVTLGVVGRGLVVLAMSVYWLANRDAFERWGLSLLAPPSRVRARETWRAVKAGVGASLRSQLAKSLVAVVILDVGFHLLGLRYPTLPAVLAGLGLLVPVVGAPFAVLVAIAAGLDQGVLEAAAAGVLACGTFILIAAVWQRVAPLRRHSALLEIFVMIALADAFGVIGLLLAATVAAAIQIAAERLLLAEAPVEATNLRGVTRRLATLRARIANSPGVVPPALVAVVERLDALVSAAQRLEERPWAPR